MLLLPADGPGKEAAERDGLRVQLFQWPCSGKPTSIWRGILRVLTGIIPTLFAHIRLIRSTGPDVVWVNTVTIPLWIIAARLLGRRVVCHAHETVGDPRWLRRLLYLPLLLPIGSSPSVKRHEPT